MNRYDRQRIAKATGENIAAGSDALVRLPEVAERMGTTVSHVREMIRTNEITHVRIGRFMRVPASEIARYIAENTTVGGAG